MPQSNLLPLLIALIFLQINCASVFNLADTTSKGGSSIYNTVCNVQTTLEFKFSTNSIFSNPSTASFSTMKFLDVYGTDLSLTLTNYALDTNNLVTGYSIPAGSGITITAAYIFQFTSGDNNVYLWIPVTTSPKPPSNSLTSVDVVDLTSGLAPSNTLANFGDSSSLSAFNFFDLTDYNQWYTTTIGFNTLLASKFIYRVASTATTSAASTVSTNLQGLGLNSDQSKLYGDKLCYASIETTGNFQTHLRESTPLWFVYIFIFIYWLFYLCSNSTNPNIYNRSFEEDKWTSWSIYSICFLAHEEFFTRISRMNILLINWSLFGVFIASIYGNQYNLGQAMIIWTAAIAVVATIPFAFIFGALFHQKIYDLYRIKYENMRATRGIIDREKLEPFEREIDNCEQKLYGYNHWYNCIAFAIFFICWPIAINQMQKLPRTHYYVHWYWLASQGIAIAIYHFIYEPLLVLLFGNTSLVRKRGGFYYDIKLGEIQRAATAN